MATTSIWTELQIAEANTNLNKMLASPVFARSERQCRFLRFIVTETLTRRDARLKEYTIGVEVFDRPEHFDPAVEAIVRVEAIRLRAKLREYYDGEGGADRVQFELPKGTYRVNVVFRGAVQAGIVDHDYTANDWPEPVLHPIKDKPSLAVLPFTNFSADPEQGYFADGITEDLTTDLSKLSGLFVIARQSAFAYKNSVKRAEDIGRELGVKYLLEGSVRRTNSRVRVAAQLIDARSGTHVWAERYDRELKDIFAVQDDITRQIVAALGIKLAGNEADRIGHEGTISLEAHDRLLRGLERFWTFTEDGVKESSKLFAEAVELDSGYAATHTWLARTLVFQWIMMWHPDPEILDRAYHHARQALALDDYLPLGHAVYGWIQLWRRQPEEALTAARQAVALDPNNADAHLFLSFILCRLGQGEEALRCIEKGMRLNPHPTAVYYCALGICYFVLGDYEKSVEAFRQGIAVSEVFISSHYFLCLVYTHLGHEEEARLEREKTLALTGGRRPARNNSIWIDEDLSLMMDNLARCSGLWPEEPP